MRRFLFLFQVSPQIQIHGCYDKDRRLAAEYTNTVDNPSTKILHAKYYYYLHGPLKRVEMGDNLQGIDYVYTADGKVKSVNSANPNQDPGNDGTGTAFSKDVFGYSLEYHPGDYSRAGTNISSIQTGGATAHYTGMVNGMAWYTQRTAASGAARTALMNTYVYDKDYSLSANTWGTPNFANSSFTATSNAWQEKGLTYDSHGNIKTLQRTNGAGATIANYSYTYKANSNQLTAVGNYASYTYDALGQLTSETKGTLSKYLDYDVSGKVIKIYSDVAKTKLVLSFVYDESGARIKKQDHLQNVTTWYVGDNVYTGMQLIEQSIPSGIYYRSANAYRYQLTDHVGSVRAIINRSKLASGAVDVIYSTDYYPFGTELQAAGIPSRYGYQGEYAEKDSETGWNNFYLRNYDPAIGRWLTVDPYGQYYSPYVGMGNDPINRFDPDGGWDGGGGGGGLWGWLKGLFSSPDVKYVDGVGIIKEVNLVSPKDTYLRPPVAIKPYTIYEPSGPKFKPSVNIIGTLGLLYTLNTVINLFSSAHIPQPMAIGFDNRNLAMKNSELIEKVKESPSYRNFNEDSDGSYTITWAGGTKYHGKGNMTRMLRSTLIRTAQLSVMGVTNPIITTLDWSPSPTEREAFKGEYQRMQTDVVPGLYMEGYRNPINLNIRQSPGKAYFLQDGF